jgi:hypothetical protein
VRGLDGGKTLWPAKAVTFKGAEVHGHEAQGQEYTGKYEDAESRQEWTGEATFNNHSGGTEPMNFQWGRGGGAGGPPRAGGAGRGSPMGRGAGRGSPASPGRRPINDPANETPDKLKRGIWWHDSTDAALRCRDGDCGIKQATPFCQGCGNHHHGREFCYKRNEQLFNATGYWSDVNKGKNPIPSLNAGTYQQPAPARLNIQDAGKEK